MVTVAISRHGGGVWQLVHAAERVHHGRPQDGAIGAQNGGQRGGQNREIPACADMFGKCQETPALLCAISRSALNLK